MIAAASASSDASIATKARKNGKKPTARRSRARPDVRGAATAAVSSAAVLPDSSRATATSALSVRTSSASTAASSPSVV